MRSRLILLGALALSLGAQQDPKDLILAVRDKIIASTGRMPRYLCTQTLDRKQFEPLNEVRKRACPTVTGGNRTPADALRLAESDRLRLDVTVASKAEIFSWVGENRFSDRSLWDFVTDGIISNGSFFSMLAMIFDSDSADFSYNGEVLSAGRTLAEFAYNVPVEQSHYQFGDRKNRWTSAYEGTVQIDPRTRELVRLVLRSVNLPSETGECQLETSMQYGTVHLNNQEFLLPAETILKTLAPSGNEQVNRSVYSGCHEFLGESKVSFDAPLEAPASSKPGPSFSASLPPGTRFTLELAQSYPSAREAFVLERGLKSDWIVFSP